ncbi:MAG TPA: HlyD family efflux transporter periplasmic adaptor subunit [Sulfurovum sp.]|nr:HlyD family efflux transporter periplasmic adaptor subunit [Sulfurovum sp.]
MKYMKYLIYLTILAVLGFGFYQKIYIPKHTFDTIRPTISNMNVIVNGIGNVGSKEIYKIGSIYGGKVFSFDINEGDFIKRGDLIAKIDSVDLNSKILEQKAMVKKLENDIKSLKLDKQSAVSTYNYQEKIFKKNQKLFEKRIIAELDFEKLKTNRDVAKLSVSSISSKIDSLYSQISQISANTDGLKERLLRYTIVAPIDGYVTKKLISNFAIINPNQTLIEIVNPKDVWVETHIDTRISGEVTIGDSATIKLRSSDKAYEGKVINISPVNNSITNERGINIGFTNLPIPFYLEEQAVIEVQVKELQDIVKVATSALAFYQEEEGVWLLQDGIVKFKPLKILAYDSKGIATKTITAQETIVIPDPKKKSLSNGMKIYGI